MAALLVVLLASGCGAVAPDPVEVRAEIQSFLEIYLPKLAEAYAEAEPQRLEGLAVPKEISSIERIVSELAATGKVIRPTLKSFTVEEVTMASNTIALVSVLEVWDLRSYAIGSNTLLQDVPDQRNRVRYQMRKDRDQWSVTFRQVVDNDLE